MFGCSLQDASLTQIEKFNRVSLPLSPLVSSSAKVVNPTAERRHSAQIIDYHRVMHRLLLLDRRVLHCIGCEVFISTSFRLGSVQGEAKILKKVS